MKRLLTILTVLGKVFTALPKAIVAMAPVFKGQKPDITPAQIKATVLFVCTQAVALGVMTPAMQSYILQAVGTLLPVALVIADVFLRSARNKAELAKVILPDA
jgi:hypothetical protein